MSEEGLSRRKYQGTSSREESCCFAHISLTLLPVLTLTVMYFHSACLCIAFTMLVTARSLPLPSVWLLLPSLPVLATLDCLWLCHAHSAIMPWRIHSVCEVFCADFMLITLHIHFSTLDSHPSSIQPVWDILPSSSAHPKCWSYQHFCSRSPCTSHWNSTLPHSHYRCTIISC